jgi:hypothetical protein
MSDIFDLDVGSNVSEAMMFAQTDTRYSLLTYRLFLWTTTV